MFQLFNTTILLLVFEVGFHILYNGNLTVMFVIGGP
jgi:hypothetical protein